MRRNLWKLLYRGGNVLVSVWQQLLRLQALPGAACCRNRRKHLQAAALPWPYPEFDVEQVRRRGYEYKYEKACMYGVVKAIATSAAEQNPQWSTLPLDAFYYGRGGAYLWGTLCGALNGGLFVLTLALGDCPQAADDLMTWYVKAQLPSLNHDEYCRFKNQQQTVSGSPLCHQSVGKWIKKTGFAHKHSGAHRAMCKDIRVILLRM